MSAPAPLGERISSAFDKAVNRRPQLDRLRSIFATCDVERDAGTRHCVGTNPNMCGSVFIFLLVGEQRVLGRDVGLQKPIIS